MFGISQIQKHRKNLIILPAIAAFAGLVAYQNREQTDRSWGIYKADAASTSYSALDQINTSNVNRLQPAWTHSYTDMKDGSRAGSSECNPIIVDGVMYTTSAKHWAYAIDAQTGEQLWAFDPFDGAEGGGVSRGVTYWEDGERSAAPDKRIFFTGGDNLFALDARTGKPITTFGENGRVSMNAGLRDDPATISVIPTSPGIVYKDLLIMGAEVSELYGAQPGYIRAYNCRTGKLEWTFHTIPLPGEPGYETWPKDAYKYAGGVNDWAGMSLDTRRGIVFLALGSPSYDFYGADRKGNNLYGNSVVALDATTGKYIWHYQLVHHDLWDYDLPAPPNLVTVHRDGKQVDAVAQVTKHGFVFVFNRETGEPLFPIEERKVPASRIPGEVTSPTQPFPVKPKPFARQWMTEADLTHYTDAGHDSIVKKFRSMRYEGLFTPPDLKGTLMLPGSRGGAEWGGAAYDPASTVLFVKSNDSPEIQSMKKVDPEQEAKDQTVYDQGKTLYMTYCVACHGKDKNGDEPNYPSLIGLRNRMTREAALDKIKKGGGKMPAFAAAIKGKEKGIIAFLYDRPQNSAKVTKQETGQTQKGADKYLNLTAYGHFRDPQGNPALRPPWGTLNAINLSTGDYEWQIPLGNDEKRQENGAPETGQEGSAGPIVTAGGLVFISGTQDRKFRAFDKKTGKLVWQTTLPGVANATACTYMSGGKQYVALSVGGTKENPSGSVIAFRLP
ncbi:outer membrane protein assembly factor BamB family protein [Dyadobacter fermentans]|uniref:outer membrane protein assembly factor BamB family protein n=1 Tax=Dyadobacter fermentans TaxID=94254 RepID=UPI001CC09EB5|nr:PQQ-binding-like beta-propeller repeat protein [Dyadobacter fermentans]MBZ1360250.1 PQQ-binding-like beta-propeller repeat protein [Dyadobacter fermentans]